MFGSEAWSLTCNSGNSIVVTLRDLDPLQEHSLTVPLTVSITYKEVPVINPAMISALLTLLFLSVLVSLCGVVKVREGGRPSHNT